MSMSMSVTVTRLLIESLNESPPDPDSIQHVKEILRSLLAEAEKTDEITITVNE